jgi:16S rRNA (guanine(527)-N(7))-methyltransferase GidB
MTYPMEHLKLTNDQEVQLERFVDFMLAFNAHTNLTSITEPTDIVIKHIEDSLALYHHVQWRGQSVLDVGTGAGFPGIVLLIMDPTIQLTLLEATTKKAVFLQAALDHLGLQARVVNERAETWISSHRESFDIVTARAVAPLPVLVEWCVPYVKVGGSFIAMKGHVEEEVLQANAALRQTNAEIGQIVAYELSQNKGSRTLVVIDKNKDNAKHLSTTKSIDSKGSD